MAKLSEKYEALVAFSAKDGEEAFNALKNKFKALIEENAELISIDEWGKRRLAYPINYENDAFYVLYNFDCGTDFPREFERVIGITDGVLRSIVTIRKTASA